MWPANALEAVGGNGCNCAKMLGFMRARVCPGHTLET